MVEFTRRTFMLSGLATATIGSIATMYAVNDAEDFIVRVVRRHLPDLDISQADMATFAADFLLYETRLTSDARLRLAMKFHQVLFSDVVRRFMPDIYVRRLEKAERIILTKFILSTNFFVRDQAAGTKVQYIAFADPYRSGCGNPFARFDS